MKLSDMKQSLPAIVSALLVGAFAALVYLGYDTLDGRISKLEGLVGKQDDKWKDAKTEFKKIETKLTDEVRKLQDDSRAAKFEIARLEGDDKALNAEIARLNKVGAAIKQKPMARGFVPPAGKCLIMIGQDKDGIENYAARFGKPAGTMAYTSIRQREGLVKGDDLGNGIQDFNYLLKQYPNSVLQMGLYMKDTANLVVAGQRNNEIDEVGQWIKNSNRPIFLRVDYEFDHPDARPNPKTIGYTPETYKAAFKYIRDRFDKKGVTNVAYVWHSHAGDHAKDFREFYPDDDLVDWVAVSFFSATPKFAADVADFARKKGKPLMIAESTPKGIGTRQGVSSWNARFVPCLKYMRDHDVRALCYINWDWDAIPNFKGQGWGDCRLQADMKVEGFWEAEMKTPRYLQPTPALFRTLGFQP